MFGNAVAANGWLQLAADALRDDGPCAERGWIALAEAERTHDLATAISQAERALEIGRAFGDAELEIHALAALGMGEYATGRSATGWTISTPRSRPRPPARTRIPVCSATSSATSSKPAHSPRT